MSTGCMASFQDATTDHADDQCQENISRSSKCHCKSGGHKSALNLYGPIYLFWTKTLFHHFSPGYLRQHVIIPGINKVYIYQEKRMPIILMTIPQRKEAENACPNRIILRGCAWRTAFVQ